MNPVDYILIAVLLAIVGGAAFYIYRANSIWETLVLLQFQQERT